MPVKTPNPFTKFSDKLAPFLSVHLGQSYFTRGDFCDNETFEKICGEYIDWYNKNKVVLIKNIKAIYALTGNDTGYDALVEDWERRRNWKGVGDVVKFDDNFIDERLTKQMGLIMNHLYQKNSYGKKEAKFESRMIGLLITHHLVVDISLSDKRRTKDVIIDYGIGISIGGGEHTEIEIDE